MLLLLPLLAPLALRAGLVLQAESPPIRPDPQKATKPEILEQDGFTVTVEGHPEMKVTKNDFAGMPHQTVKVDEHGTTVEYGGVPLHDVLARAGAPLGAQLRGKALSTYVLATARDGYAVVYTLAEMDPAFREGDLLVADRSGGSPLPATQGPFRIVSPHEKKPARSLRMLETITVVQLRK